MTCPSDPLTIAQRDEIRQLYLAVTPHLNEDQRARCRQAQHGTREQAQATIEWLKRKISEVNDAYAEREA